jgi:transposase
LEDNQLRGRSAAELHDGAMYNRRGNVAYVERCLAPALKRNDIVMLDNLPVHKAAGVREAIEARGATLRPKYSPDLNPIEMPFSQMKAGLRKAGERTIPRFRRRIRSFARTLTPRQAANYFRHAGYA